MRERTEGFSADSSTPVTDNRQHFHGTKVYFLIVNTTVTACTQLSY